ncbi:TetR/AcrR family transcriptional regulator [Nocardia brasiliensis]|uniref:TetR/AcrR family transcriptional regulator n=1 Tax=Nocardia brasiliensis TaxID=37326 RepID=UPI00068E9A01|nr:TetR/AcrR family transcriptional regulator [Nocardia brasiliensis]MBF6126052.1 TetR/AcrR family transcriptional regulator [Nocardia brasiliensis]MBF6542941.1 TetR/AcrR family transcriptional regulator [Nocardia brasiliensis]
MAAEDDGAIPGMRRWRGRSPAARVAMRRDQLIEACTELMATIGAAETSMRGVCRQAGLTERYFYESFPNLDALLTTVLDTVVLGARDRLLAALPSAPLDRAAMFRHLVTVFTDYLTEDRRRGRIMFVESQATPVLMPRANQLIGLFTAPIALTIGAGDYTDPGPDEHDSALNASAIFGALAYLYRPWLDGEIPVSRERFDEHAATVLENVARVRSSAGSET